jgi:exonuclease VII small subunit
LYPYISLVVKIDQHCDTVSQSVSQFLQNDKTVLCSSLEKDVLEYTSTSTPGIFESQVTEQLKTLLDNCSKKLSSQDFQKEFFLFYDELTSISYKINDQKLALQDSFENYAKTIQQYREKMNILFNSKQQFPNQFYFLF